MFYNKLILKYELFFMTRNTYDGFQILNADFLIANLAQYLSEDLFHSIENINLDNMVHRYPQHILTHIKAEFVARCRAEKKSTISFLSKHFNWSRDTIPLCEIILHAVSENQFINLNTVVAEFEALMVLRLHGLQITRNISLIHIDQAFAWVEYLIKNEQNRYYCFNSQEAEPMLHKNLKLHQVILRQKKYEGTYYFADNIEMNYWRLINEVA